MNILYVAKHGSGGNQDEDAVSHVLEQLGHRVVKVQERRASQDVQKYPSADFCLIHHLNDFGPLDALKGRMPVVFWYFDLVEFPDPTLEGRNRTRRAWMELALSKVDMGFCTDGDWVLKNPGRNLHWLPQGCDERVAFPGAKAEQTFDLLFTGIHRRGGDGREGFVREVSKRYGKGLLHIITGVHGRALADTIAKCKIVICPNSPVTDNYWSNRLFLSTGFAGCVLHPWTSRAADMYQAGEEVMFYDNMHDFHDKVEYLLAHPERRESIAREGYRRAVSEHTYRHRVEQMLKTIKEGGLT